MDKLLAHRRDERFAPAVGASNELEEENEIDKFLSKNGSGLIIFGH